MSTAFDRLTARSTPGFTALAAVLGWTAPAAAQARAAPRVETHAPRVDLDALATYGLGNGHTFGALVHATLSFDAWRTASARGTLELGAWAGYQNEPIALQPWIVGNAIQGTTHRVPVAVTFGHTFRFAADGRVSFGVHLYGGLVHWHSEYRVRLPARAIDANGVSAATVPDVGAFLRFTWRPHPRVGLAVQAGAPIYGVSPETVVGLFTVGLGLTVRLR